MTRFWIFFQRIIPLAILLFAGCASVEVEDYEQQSARATTMEMNVKGALLDADDVWGAAIRVIYARDSITLEGFVDDPVERRRAVETARQAVPGVDVIDELKVWSG